jgi:hypothetical protein
VRRRSVNVGIVQCFVTHRIDFLLFSNEHSVISLVIARAL